MRADFSSKFTITADRARLVEETKKCPSFRRLIVRLGAVALVLVLVALPPVGVAAAQALNITVERVLLPEGTSTTQELTGMLCRALGGADAFVLRSPTLTIERVERPLVTVGPVRQYTGLTVAMYVLTNATVTILRPAGWIAYDGLGAGIVAHMEITSELQPARVDDPHLSTADAILQSDKNDPGFSRSWEGPLIATSVAGARSLEGGGGEFKIYGSELRLQANENDTRVQTGHREAATPLDGSSAETWLVLRAPHLVGALTTTTPCDALTPTFAGTATNEISFEGATGTIFVGEEEVKVERETFQARTSAPIHIVPSSVSGVIGVNTEGALESVSLRGTTIAPVGPSRPWLPLTIVAGAVFAAGVGGVLMRRRRQRIEGPPRDADLDAQSYSELASLASEREDYEAALALNLKAQERARGSARLVLDEAWFRAKLGQRSAAVALYRRLASRGEAEAGYMASTLLARDEPDEAAAFLIPALRAAPELALQAEDDDALQALVNRPDVALALERALRELD